MSIEAAVDMLEKRIARGRRTASRVIEGRVVIFFLGKKKIEAAGAENIIEHVNDENTDSRWYELDKEATFLWALLDRKPKVREAIEEAVNALGLDRAIAQECLLKFIKKLSENGFIDFVD